MTESASVDVLVIGSGAGGATTALELARAGLSVLVLEEGDAIDVTTIPEHSPELMRRTYRHRGMNPILGPVPIGVVEGRCVGGGTEINSGFWARAPRDILLGWESRYGLEGARLEDLEEHYEWAEQQLDVGLRAGDWPAVTRAFADGIDAMGWSYAEVPRVATAESDDGGEHGATLGMSRSLLPKAEALGAVVMTGCRVAQILHRRGRVEGVVAQRRRGERVDVLRIRASHVVVACGATETPALLRRSGIRRRIGNTLRTHPMLKIAARFPQPLNAAGGPLPLLQVKQFAPEITLGGAFFSHGHLAMMLSDNWEVTRHLVDEADYFGTFYVAVKGNGKGLVRPSLVNPEMATIRYDLSSDDLKNLSLGLGRLSMLLLAAGADELFASVQGLPPITDQLQAVRWLDERLPKTRLSLTTVHLFSSCPAGERRERCAVDSFGRVFDYENLTINDASILPDSPGTNPQATVMAMARRNTLRLLEELNREGL